MSGAPTSSREAGVVASRMLHSTRMSIHASTCSRGFFRFEVRDGALHGRVE
jgi:hypothetical protein